ncbi:TPA: hypothetical protein QFD33_002396 [Enterococcus faecium]|nr:hypothetical protein [Enterococcus faecium]
MGYTYSTESAASEEGIRLSSGYGKLSLPIVCLLPALSSGILRSRKSVCTVNTHKSSSYDWYLSWLVSFLCFVGFYL